MSTSCRPNSGIMSTATTHFSAIPWCKELIEDEAWTPTRTASRVPKSSSEDSFFAETLQTDRTIRHCLSLRPTNPEHDFQTRGHGPAYKEIRTIIELGNGLNGHPNICHGGFVATLLDEVFGVLLTHNIEMRSRARRDSSRTGRSLPPAMGMNGFTACEYRFVIFIECEDVGAD